MHDTIALVVIERKRILAFLPLVAILLTNTCFDAQTSHDGPNFAAAANVQLEFGRVTGELRPIAGTAGCEYYLGLPYALPPKRFASPVAWNKPFPNNTWNGSYYGWWCPQLVGTVVSGREDCLTLSVFRSAAVQPKTPVRIYPNTLGIRENPSHYASQKPHTKVMIWLHGGSFLTGDGGDNGMYNRYDGCRSVIAAILPIVCAYNQIEELSGRSVQL